VKYETKTHEDEDDPGVVPIIKPLRAMLDAIKPEIASGWMFPNTIGGKRRGKHSIDKCGLCLATDAERPRRLG
jgi:hypothetical protein